jgi:hypothetical protein
MTRAMVTIQMGEPDMSRTFRFVTRVMTTGLLAAAVLIFTSPTTGLVSVRAAGCPSPASNRPPAEGTAKCYGSRILTFRAYVQYPCTDGCGGTNAYVLAPRWLDSMVGSHVELGTGPRSRSIAAFVPPRLGRCSAFAALSSCLLRPGHWAIVKARFNDPISRTCRYSEHPSGPGFSRKDAVAECRANLVVHSIVPVAPETNLVAPLEEPASRSDPVPFLASFVAALVVAAGWLARREATWTRLDQ